MKTTPNHSRRVALLIVLALLVGSSAAWGYPGHGRCPGTCEGDGPHGPMHHGRLFEQLDLTDDQKEQIHALMTTHRDAMQDSREQMRTLRQEVADRIHAGSFDEASVRTAAQAVAEAEVEMAVERARLVQQIRTVLTPEQQQKAEELMRERRDRMQDGGPGFRHGRGFHGKGRGARRGPAWDE